MHLLKPNWPAPSNVRAVTTTRLGGVSVDAYASLNLSTKVDDSPVHVAENIEILMETLELQNLPLWLTQVHGSTIIAADQSVPFTEADASYTQKPDIICTVLTADCLPLLICDKQGTTVAAIHAGWRGLAAGVIEASVRCLLDQLSRKASDLLVWLGPAIGPSTFEVDEPVYEAFVAPHPEARQAFIEVSDNHWLANLYMLAKQRLAVLGVTEVYGGDHCTFTEKDLFYSFRRDGQTGRMASMIWLERD
jgi:YfiH family protein